MKMKSLVCLLVVLFAGSFASATIIVGDGDNSVNVYFVWSDGFEADFEVSFDGASITGWEAFDVITTETALAENPLTTVVEDFGWGDFIDGISFEGHSNVGYGGGEDWWHYWIKDAGQGWVSPAYGLSDRVFLPGDMDGWVYGSAAAPVPEPATMLLLAAGGLLVRRKRS